MISKKKRPKFTNRTLGSFLVDFMDVKYLIP